MEYEYKQYPASVVELAYEIRRIVDDYRARKVSNADFVEILQFYSVNQSEKLYTGKEYNITIQRKVGKRRMAVIDKVLDGSQLFFREEW